VSSSADVILWSGREGATARWTAHASEDSGAAVLVEPDSGALRFDFNLVGTGSWAIARLEMPVTLPEHYAAVARLRGQMQPNELQLKLIDPSFANVWWWRLGAFTTTGEPQTLVLRQPALQFAWGPRSGGEPRQLGAVELAIAIERGGAGTLWIDELRLEARDPWAARPTIHGLRASSSAPGRDIECIGRNDDARWRPAADDADPWIEIDLGRHSEIGGVVIDFGGAAFDAPSARLFGSEDGAAWSLLAQQPASPSPRVWLRTDEGEARHLRIELKSREPIEVTRIAVVPLELAVSPAHYILGEAAHARRGMYPRHLLREQTYWAVVGGDGDERKGLLAEDGALEVTAESFSIEPFLYVGGRLVTWADAEITQSLLDGHLPIPCVEWNIAELRLRITAFATGEPGLAVLVARYEIENLTDEDCALRLFLAVRPFQVNPTWQSLNMIGGIAPIRRIEHLGNTVHINEEHAVIAVTAASAFGASASEHGIDALETGQSPPLDHIDDPVGFATGVLAYDLRLAAREQDVVVAAAVPLYETSPLPPSALSRDQAIAWVDARMQETAAAWRERLARVPIALPACADEFLNSVRASIAWILVNREGPRIQPGPRNYRRSWIRDGAMTGGALAEMGFAAELEAFLRWYAPHQLEDGRVPCAVDRRGVDLVAEHDSHGQLIWSIVELYRLTGDPALLREMWPRVQRAASAIASLRAQQTREELRGSGAFGLLPPSISHEGYSSQPVHSYWDDLFALRGLRDAGYAAGVLGRHDDSRRLRELYEAMRADFRDSVRRIIAEHGIDFIPGSVELGDLDPASTAIAFDPCQEDSLLPRAELARTFELFWQRFQQRRQGAVDTGSYSAYEARNALAMMMLGMRERGFEALQWFVRDQRPQAWRQWPEVSTADPREPRFVGDLPHGWIASGFVRIVRRMLAFERLDDDALILAAGVPADWLAEEPGVQVKGMPSYYGPIEYTMKAAGDGAIRVTLGPLRRWPAAGVILEPPLTQPLRHVTIDGRRTDAADARRAVLREPAREVVLET